MTFISRIFGLIRDIMIARLFGASAGADAFFVAFRIPNLFRRLFAEGAFSQAFMPILAHSKANDSALETKSLINHIGAYLLKILVVVTFFAVILAPAIILLFAFGFYAYPEKFTLASDMLRITFPYLLFISLTAFCGAILNTYQRFAAPAFTPVLLNISIIFCAIFLAPSLEKPIIALAWGVLIGGILQLLFQLPFLKKIDKLPQLNLHFFKNKHPAIKTLKQKILPAIFGASVVQINLLVDTIIASFLITGSISWLYYSDRLLELPLALIGIALSITTLAKLANYYAKHNHEQFIQTLKNALNVAFIFGLPASIGLILLSEPLIITLFGYNEFTPYDSSQSAASLTAYSIGLLALITVKIFASAFYARGDVKTPVKIGVVAVFSNIIFNLIFAYYLGHTGLALATSFSAMINVSLLYYYLHKHNIYPVSRKFSKLKLYLQVILSSAIMSIFLVYFSKHSTYYLLADVWQRALSMSLTILLAMLVYFFALTALGFRIKNDKNG